jgi:hypothetical protein
MGIAAQRGLTDVDLNPGGMRLQHQALVGWRLDLVRHSVFLLR